ncbi:MAG: hypothetical protein K2V38_07280, partial [Gemmataceae bacterium]|nr:hypothetical protein [Gemmataceae bacterium]
PASGNSSQSLLDLTLTGLVLANTGLVIEASVTGLNTINAPVLTTVFTGTAGRVTAQTWVAADGSDAGLFGTTGPLTTGSLSPGGAAFSAPFSDPNTFTLTTRITVSSIGSLGTIAADSDNKVTATPAPAGLALMLGVLPALALRARFRRAATA